MRAGADDPFTRYYAACAYALRGEPEPALESLESGGIIATRAMALSYQNLAKLTDRELAARGLTRADIPRAVLAAFNGR